MNQFSRVPSRIIEGNHTIHVFDADQNVINSDKNVVNSFGEEWSKFNHFDEDEITKIGEEYFSVVADVLTKDTYAMDVGCGTGRWTKYLSKKVSFIEAVDPSEAIFAADRLLNDTKNVRLTQAFVDNLPFEDETFDFVMSVGVLHHIPDTQQALIDCVKKVKRGGVFYVYLYYNLENRGLLFKTLFRISDIVRKFVSAMSATPKKIVCDILAVVFYLPFVYLSRFLKLIGLDRLSMQIPLSGYRNKSFYIIRNDALDRFGTNLEQRFSKMQIEEMMKNAGLNNIVFGKNLPYYHAFGKKL